MYKYIIRMLFVSLILEILLQFLNVSQWNKKKEERHELSSFFVCHHIMTIHNTNYFYIYYKSILHFFQ